MKKINFNYSLPIVLGFLLLFSACGNDKNPERQAQGGAPAMPYPVVAVPQKTVTAYKSYPAKIEGVVNSEVRPKIPGYITDVLVDAGDRVKKGQMLFKLETQSLSQDAAAARANVNAAQVEVDKLKPLVDKNIISSVQLETAKAKLAQAQSAYNSIAANIGYANIKSPVDGIVGSINFRKGALVSSQDPVPLTNVSSIEKVYANFSMDEKSFLTFVQNSKGASMEEKIKNLAKVKLILANGEEYDKEGTIETISGDIDPLTGTVAFRASFDNAEGILRNGSTGTIKVPQMFTDATVVPTISTFERQGKTFVYKVQGDTLVATAIDVVTEANKIYVINNGVQKDDSILAKGLNKVREGLRIKPQPTAIDSILDSFNTVFN
jgi:membrane fusion protein (multidrug efflux system)